MRIAEIRNLADAGNFREALYQVEKLLTHVKECPYLWNLRGVLILLQESDDMPLPAEAAQSYLHALELDPDNLEALEGLAHFYDVVDPRPTEAKKYASEYLETAKPIFQAMERILAEQTGTTVNQHSKKKP